MAQIKVFDCDFSYLDGTNCFCSDESADVIRTRTSSMPLHAIHMIGTGDYHYQTLFWLERIEEDFALMLYDNHPDDQVSAFGADILSCGSWVKNAKALGHLKAFSWFRGDGTYDPLPEGLPVYLSIDLDVLSNDHAHTDWSQGKISLGELCIHIRTTLDSHRLLGVDICGGLTEQKGASPEDQALNARTEEALIGLISSLS